MMMMVVMIWITSASLQRWCIWQIGSNPVLLGPHFLQCTIPRHNKQWFIPPRQICLADAMTKHNFSHKRRRVAQGTYTIFGSSTTTNSQHHIAYQRSCKISPCSRACQEVDGDSKETKSCIEKNGDYRLPSTKSIQVFCPQADCLGQLSLNNNRWAF